MDERLQVALALVLILLCFACAGFLDHPENSLPWEETDGLL